MIIGMSKSGLPKALVAASIGLAVGQSGAHALQVSDTLLRASSLLPARRLVLTYDDGPGANSPAIAFYLAARGIPATFFLNGCRFKFMPPPITYAGRADLTCASVVDRSFLNTLLALGHRVANHTQDHPFLTELLPDYPAEVERQVLLTHELLKTVVPDQLYVFRPGSLNWNAGVAAVVRAAVPELIGPFHHEFKAIDHKCLDTETPSDCANIIFESIDTDPVNHGMILLHDRLISPHREDGGAEQNTFGVTKTLVDSLVANGYVFVPIDAIPGVLGPRRFGRNCSGWAICMVDGPWTSSFSNADGWGDYSSYYRSIRLADIDGDGDADVCGRATDGLWCAKSNGSSFGTPKRWTSKFSNPDGWLPDKYGTTIQFGDLDGDGDADVCGRGVDGLWCARSMGKQGSEFFAFYGLWSDDFSDAEGFGAAASYYRSFRLADVDGNGTADACVRASWGIGCALSNGWMGFHSLTPWLESDFTNADGWLPEQYGSTIMFGDLNGDGRADVCGRGYWGISCARSVRGNAFETASDWITARYSNRDEWYSASKYGSLRMGDVNGDGRADLCGRNDTGMVCVFSDGARFSGYLHLNHSVADRSGWGPLQYSTTVQLGDVNGDGLADLCGRGSAGIYCWKAAEALRASTLRASTW